MQGGDREDGEARKDSWACRRGLVHIRSGFVMSGAKLHGTEQLFSHPQGFWSGVWTGHSRVASLSYHFGSSAGKRAKGWHHLVPELNDSKAGPSWGPSLDRHCVWPLRMWPRGLQWEVLERDSDPREVFWPELCTRCHRCHVLLSTSKSQSRLCIWERRASWGRGGALWGGRSRRSQPREARPSTASAGVIWHLRARDFAGEGRDLVHTCNLQVVVIQVS